MTYPSRTDLEMRLNWRQRQRPECMSCRVSSQDAWPPLAVHEIERRSQAPKTWCVEENFLLVCGRCHEKKFATMPHAEQLALKWRRDPCGYESLAEFLSVWRAIKPRCETYVTCEDVERYL